MYHKLRALRTLQSLNSPLLQSIYTNYISSIFTGAIKNRYGVQILLTLFRKLIF